MSLAVYLDGYRNDMEEPPFEDLTCIICNLGHWVLAGLVALGAVAYLTRGYWGPGVWPTPTPTPAPMVIRTSPEPTAVAELYGYTNTNGGYAFNYPSTWTGIETQGDVVFSLPDGATVYVHVEPAAAGQSLDQFVAEAETYPPYEILTRREIIIGGASAVCREVAQEGQSRLAAFSCLTLYNDRRYVVILSDLTPLREDAVSAHLDDFGGLLASFHFLP